MAENPERLAQIMQRMQVSNQRTLGNRFGGGYSGVSSATAPTPPSEPIDFSRNTLSPPSMAEPDDTGPGQQMPSVIQPPASGNVGMPSGGNAYSGSQPGVSPSTRDLYSLPDYSGGMRGGMGGDDRLDRLLKMLSSYMGSQMAPPSAAPPPAPVEATPPSIDQPELQNPVEYTGGSQLPAPSPAPSPAPAQEGIGYVPAIGLGNLAGTQFDMQIPQNKFGQPNAPSAIPKGLKQGNSMLTAMEEYYNKQTGEHYSGGMGMSEPGSDWVRQNETGYVARDYSKEPPPDLVRLGTAPGTYTPQNSTRYSSLLASNTPSLSSLDGRSPQAMPSTPAAASPGGLTPDMQMLELMHQQRPITNDPKSPNFNPNLNVYGEKGPAWKKGMNITLATNESAAPSPATMGNKYKSLRQSPYTPSNSDPSSPENAKIYFD